jgi:acyl-CoA thioester hydrolase
MDDVLVVATRTVEMRGASLVMDQRITRGEEPITAATVLVAALAAGRPARIPDGLRQLLHPGVQPKLNPTERLR